MITKQRREKPTVRLVESTTTKGERLVVGVRATVLEIRVKHTRRLYRMPWAEVFEHLAGQQQRMWTDLVVVEPKKRGRAKQTKPEPRVAFHRDAFALVCPPAGQPPAEATTGTAPAAAVPFTEAQDA